MGRKPVEIEKVIQNLKSNLFIEDITYDPPQPRRFYTDNIVIRTLAHLVGLSSIGSKMLTATTNGILKVALTGAGYDHNDTKAGNAPDAYGSALAFDAIVSRLDVYIFDNVAIIKRTNDGTTYDDEIEVPANTVYSFDCTTHSINIKNKTATQVARFQIVGWY